MVVISSSTAEPVGAVGLVRDGEVGAAAHGAALAAGRRGGARRHLEGAASRNFWKHLELEGFEFDLSSSQRGGRG